MADNSHKLLDETRWHILAILQENARIPLKELGKRVGLSSPAVTERVHRLEEAGIIVRYSAKLNLEKLGLPITAFISIKSFGHYCSEVRQLLRARPEIVECNRVTGNDHYFAKVVVTDVSHLEQLVDCFIPYATVATSIVLSTPVNGRIINNDIFPDS